VPRGAAELAVRDRLQADFSLHPHDLADGVVLDGAEVPVGEAAGGVLLAGLQQLRRPQEAADVVGAERRLVAEGHGRNNERG
jgi:hypothetical protein